MGALDGFRLDTDDLARLAAGTADVAVQVRAAGGQARPIQPADFGRVGTAFGVGAFALAQLATDAIDDMAVRTDRAADSLRATVDAYTSIDEAAGAVFDRLAR